MARTDSLGGGIIVLVKVFVDPSVVVLMGLIVRALGVVVRVGAVIRVSVVNLVRTTGNWGTLGLLGQAVCTEVGGGDQ